MERHSSYDYVLKTDDDSYLGLDEITRILQAHRPKYWGYCMLDTKWRHPYRDPEHKYYVSEETYSDELYPVWAQGMGYALSRTFNRCAVNKFERMEFMPMEDVATGIAAKQCNATCQSNEWISWDATGYTSPLRVEHKIKSSSAMIFTHWENMELMGIGEYAEFE